MWDYGPVRCHAFPYVNNGGMKCWSCSRSRRLLFEHVLHGWLSIWLVEAVQWIRPSHLYPKTLAPRDADDICRGGGIGVRHGGGCLAFAHLSSHAFELLTARGNSVWSRSMTPNLSSQPLSQPIDFIRYW